MIGVKKPNPIGLFDVLGNLNEAAIGESVANVDHGLSVWGGKGLSSETILNIRGGSFLSNIVFCNSGSHHHIHSGQSDINAGFRIVRTLRPSP